MKKITLLIAILFFGILFYNTNSATAKPYLNKLFYYSYCEEPTEYRIGEIDKNFDITTEEFTTLVNQAAELWNKNYHKPLLAYNSQAELSVNMVYDERQQLLVDISNKTQNVNTTEDTLQTESESYQREFAELNARVNKLNAEIDYWNEKGGAPENVFKEIEETQKELNKRIDLLNRSAQNINSEIAEFNNKISTVNSTIENYNSVLQQKPEGGLYMPQEKRIEIYIFDSRDSLFHVLAHELGHAIGTPHNEEQGSIMNPVISPELELTTTDIKDLKEYCAERKKIDYLLNKVEEMLKEKKIISR